MSADGAVRITRDPDPYERYHLALGYRTGELIILSGHASLDDEAKFVPGDFTQQAGRALEGLRLALASAGVGMDSIIKLTAFVTDIDTFGPQLTQILRKVMAEPWPAMTIVQITMARHPEWLVEIEAIACARGVRRIGETS